METEELAAKADRLAVMVVMLAHDAHPTYSSTTGWRGGIGGQAMTTCCSIIDPPPGEDWTQYDLPTHPAREWLRERAAVGSPVDIEAVKAELKAEVLALLR